MALAAVITASAGAGWALRDALVAEAEPRPLVAEARAAPPLVEPAVRPGAQRYADGTVSVHVDRVQSVTLFDELDRAGVRLPSVDAPASHARSSALRPAAVRTAAPAAGLARLLREGGDADREDAWLSIQQTGALLDATLLRDAFLSEPVERVRLLAFAGYLDALASDGAALRAALQTAVYDQSAAVQADARRRLDELEQLEQAAAATPPQ